VLYAIQSEVRFGRKARTVRTGQNDRGSTLFVSIVSILPIVGFAVATKIRASGLLGLTVSNAEWLLWPALRRDLAAIGWTGAAIAAAGIVVRFWAVIILRERYTRTLLVHKTHAIELGGPYSIVRHPGYLGSLLFFDGIALSSCSAVVLVISVTTTLAAYIYRITVEDQMLIAQFGDEYRLYRRQVPALIPFIY
jgi:protein-S-isoprenylcysteine O-methyltransferase Ste14